MTTATISLEDLTSACSQMLPRLGAKSLQIRYCDEEQPVVWMAVAEFADVDPQVAAALNPGRALLRLLEQLVDGGKCTHCNRPTGITLEVSSQLFARLICWYQYDPELKVFRRGCEDGAP
jgi:hypothetical protein